MIKLKNVSFQYKDSEQDNSLHDVTFCIPKGEVVLICGESGCGKTTITRLINGLIPHYYEGNLEGEVTVAGKVIAGQPIHETARYVGSVFQNPRSQFFNVDTTSEIVFGCENMGYEISDLEHRLEQVTQEFGIENLLGRNLFHLSGGEKQKIACAAVSMANPDVLVLDEPTSNLDSKSIQMLAEVIRMWKKQGKTVIVAEHRLHYLKQVADRVLYMEHGRIAMDISADRFWKLPMEEIRHRGLRSTSTVDFSQVNTTTMDTDCLELQNFCFSYEDGTGLNIPTLKIPQGAIVGIIGNNGAGKTTFARCLCGLEKKASGTLKTAGQTWRRRLRLKNSYLVMQDVNHQLFTESVQDEVLLSLEEKDEEKAILQAQEIMDSLNVLEYQEIHPMALSGGQKQRVAIASAIAANKQLIVFDEPTSGLDYTHMKAVATNLKKLSRMGKTLFIITHDPELIAECCNYFVFMQDGKVKWSDGWNPVSQKRVADFFNVV